MSVRGNLSGESLSLASQTNGARTMAGWFYIVAQSGYSSLCSETDYTGVFCGVNGSRVLEPWIGSANPGTGSTLALNTWYYVAYTLDGTGAGGDFNLYVDGVLDLNATVNRPTGTETVYFGGDGIGNEFLDGRSAYLRMWDAELTVEEILDEMTVTKANRTDNLVADLWTQDGVTERARDYSGNGNNFTENGTLADEDNPPIDDIGGYAWLVADVVAGGGRTASLANTLADFSSASAAQVLVEGTGANTLEALASVAVSEVLVQGTGANTLEAFVSAGVISSGATATLANTLVDFTSASAAQVQVSATGANTLASFTSAAASQVQVTATSARTLAAFVSAGVATGGNSRTATLANTLEAFTSSSSSEVLVQGTLANTLDVFVSAGAAVSGSISATLANTLAPFSSASVARVAIAASLTISLLPFTSSGVITLTDPYSSAETPIEFSLDLNLGSLPKVDNFDDVYDELLEVHNALDLSVTELNTNKAAASADVAAIHARLNTLDSAIVALQAAIAALP